MTRRLLITDDAMIIREMIKDAVKSDGWEIAGEAINGQDAIDKYKELRPTAVTLDLVMPEFDGLHALRGILEEDPHAKVLVVSAIDQTDVLKDALRIGAIDFIVKPFEKARLINALSKMAANELNTSAT